jgi:hypothetical protein
MSRVESPNPRPPWRRHVGQPLVPGWEIVEYQDREGQPPRFAVEEWGQRRAWGLRDTTAAERWLTRLAKPAERPPARVQAELDRLLVTA